MYTTLISLSILTDISIDVTYLPLAICVVILVKVLVKM